MNSRRIGIWKKVRLDVPANTKCEIIIHNINVDECCKVGVRNIGSINQEFSLGPKNFASRIVETDTDSTIEAYFEQKAEVKYFLSRLLDPLRTNLSALTYNV
jgi:hypothetical protein